MGLSADRISVREHQSVTLTCTVKDATDLVDEITFVRSTDQKNVSCGHISQQLSKCEVLDMKSRYNPSCGSGANTTSSKIKKYTMKIQSINVVDFTDWWCQTKLRKNNDHIITLIETSK